MIERAEVARFRRTIFAIASLGLASCSSSDDGEPQPASQSGGAPSTGGMSATGGVTETGGNGTTGGSGGDPSTGGNGTSTGGAPTDSGGTGGAPASGGQGGAGGNGALDSGVIIIIDPPPELSWTREGTSGPKNAIWGSGPSDIYATDVTQAWHWTATTWTSESTNAAGRLEAVWGSGPTDVYIAVFANVMLHSTGNGIWEHQAAPSGYTFRDVWGSGPNDVYAAGSSMMHSTGDGTWTPAGNVAANAIWGSSATDVYAAGVGPDVFHLAQDGRWLRQSTTADNLEDIWGTGPTDIYTIGTGKIFHSTGDGAWTEQPAPAGNGAFLRCVWALNERAVYVGTDAGVLLYSGGDGRWFAQTVANSPPINGIWGTTPENLYVATATGIYHGVTP